MKNLEIQKDTVETIQEYVNGLPVFSELIKTYMSGAGLSMKDIIESGGKVKLRIDSAWLEITPGSQAHESKKEPVSLPPGIAEPVAQ